MTNVMRPTPEPNELRDTATKLCQQYLGGLLTVTDLTMGLLEASEPWTEDFFGPREDEDDEDDEEEAYKLFFGGGAHVDNVVRLRQPRLVSI